MMGIRMGVALLCLMLFLSTAVLADEKMLLTDLKVITLYQGQMTSGRRSSPVAQLSCVGGTAGCRFKPSTVQCTNQGHDGTSVQWKCEADMDNAYRFGRVSVSCEGYDYSGDPNILKGSCGLEYTIDLTEEGLRHQRYHGGGDGEGGLGVISAFAIMILVVFVFFTAYLVSMDDYRWRYRPWGPMGWGYYSGYGWGYHPSYYGGYGWGSGYRGGYYGGSGWGYHPSYYGGYGDSGYYGDSGSYGSSSGGSHTSSGYGGTTSR